MAQERAGQVRRAAHSLDAAVVALRGRQDGGREKPVGCRLAEECPQRVEWLRGGRVRRRSGGGARLKEPSGPVLVCTPGEWAMFVAGTRRSPDSWCGQGRLTPRGGRHVAASARVVQLHAAGSRYRNSPGGWARPGPASRPLLVESGRALYLAPYSRSHWVCRRSLVTDIGL